MVCGIKANTPLPAALTVDVLLLAALQIDVMLPDEGCLTIMNNRLPCGSRNEEVCKLRPIPL